MTCRIGCVLLVVGFALVRPANAAAQCSTPAKMLTKTLDGKAAFDAARAEATHWMGDSVLIRMEATVAGPVTATGQAGHWMLQFSSPSAKKLEIVNLMNGEMSCSVADVAIVAEAVAVTPDTIFDTRKLYGIAQQAGGSKQDPQKAKVLAALDKPAGQTAQWVVTYVSPQGMPLLTVKIDSQTGAVVK